MRLIPYLFINKITVFQPPYSAIFFIKDPWPDYIISSLYSAILSRNLAPLLNSPFIYSLMPLYKLIFKIIWSPDFISRCSHYTPTGFLSSVSASMPHLSPWVPFTPPGGFVPINLPVCLNIINAEIY